MASVLLPKYSLGQISANFFNRGQGVTVAQFVNNNFTQSTTTLSSVQAQSTPVSQVDNNLLNSMIVDYGNGPISMGMQSLTSINTNVVTGTIQSSDIFNNYIIYGGNILFNTVTNAQGRLIVLSNLQIVQILNVVSATLQNNFYTIIDAIVQDLKKGTYLSSNYSTSLLRQARIIAESASGILNGINN